MGTSRIASTRTIHWAKNLNLAQVRDSPFWHVSFAPILDPPLPRHNGGPLQWQKITDVLRSHTRD